MNSFMKGLWAHNDLFTMISTLVTGTIIAKDDINLDGAVDILKKINRFKLTDETSFAS